MENIEFIEQFSCDECVPRKTEGPYYFMGRNFSRENYDLICYWLITHNYKHIIGTADNCKYYLREVCETTDDTERYYFSSCPGAPIYCPHHAQHSNRFKYIECERCFNIYFIVRNMICCRPNRELDIESIPDHICNCIDMEIFLTSCYVESDYHSAKKLSDKKKQKIMQRIFPNTTKSARN